MTARTVRLVAGPVVAALAGLVAGIVLGALAIWLFTASSDGDAWSDLAGVILGAMAGASLAVLVWVIGLVVAARALFPRGRRLGAVMLTMGTTAVVVVGLTLLLRVVDVPGAIGLEPVVLVAVVGLITSSAMFPLWDLWRGEPADGVGAGGRPAPGD